MLGREDGKHLSHSEFMESDIFALIESELRVYEKKLQEEKKENEMSVDKALDLI